VRAVRGLLEDGEHFADFDVGAFLVLDVGEYAGAIGAHFEIDFLGFELDKRLARVDRIALLFSHFATRASTTDSPSSGTTILVDMPLPLTSNL
jgi:hypothetical protein